MSYEAKPLKQEKRLHVYGMVTAKGDFAVTAKRSFKMRLVDTSELFSALDMLPDGAMNLQERYSELFVVKAVLNPTPGTQEFLCRLEPSKFLLNLIAAVGTKELNGNVT